MTTINIYDNPIMATDSYKFSHFKQYPNGTENIFSYFESRGGIYDETVFFGLQAILKNYFQGIRITTEMVDEAERYAQLHFGTSDLFNRDGWMRIVNVHGGRIPLRIKAVEEGSVVPTSNVLMTVENTDPELPWVTNWFETILSQVWYPTTVATNSREIKKVVKKYFDRTSDSNFLDFQVHDFGYRGVTTQEQAGYGSAGHLISFKGTDTLAGIVFADRFYSEKMAGFSIAASEHSTVTAWGRMGEPNALSNMLTQFPTGIVAFVSDSYDIQNMVQVIIPSLKDVILTREGKLVVRPDSGDPVATTEFVIKSLWDTFGGTINSKGFKVLDPHIGIIQGDGVDIEMIDKILANFERLGFSAENIAFGSGGGLLQKFNRDTLKFAFKCSSIVVNGEERDVRKFPMEMTADGKYQQSFKISKGGRLQLFLNGHTYETVTGMDEEFDELKLVFENGVLFNETTFEDIRKRAQL